MGRGYTKETTYAITDQKKFSVGHLISFIGLIIFFIGLYGIVMMVTGDPAESEPIIVMDNYYLSMIVNLWQFVATVGGLIIIFIGAIVRRIGMKKLSTRYY